MKSSFDSSLKMQRKCYVNLLFTITKFLPSIKVLDKKTIILCRHLLLLFVTIIIFSVPHLSIKACRTKLQLDFTRRIIQSQCYCMPLYQKKFCFAFANKIIRVTARMYNKKLAKKNCDKGVFRFERNAGNCNL